MKELQEVRNEVLHLKNMGVLHKKEETKLLNKLNALEKAISVTRCSLELPSKETLTFDEFTFVHFNRLKENQYSRKSDLKIFSIEQIADEYTICTHQKSIT